METVRPPFLFAAAAFSYIVIGPYPAQLVVVIAVRNAVSAATMTFTATSIIPFFFIVSSFRFQDSGGEGRSLVGHLPSSLLHLTSTSSGRFRPRLVRHRLHRYLRCYRCRHHSWDSCSSSGCHHHYSSHSMNSWSRRRSSRGCPR